MKDFKGGAMMKYIKSITPIMGTLQVVWSDGHIDGYDMVDLGCDWFRMSNDCFYEAYGFNFNPHNYPGLYERCRNIVYPEK